jgi:adenosylcobinamide-GDP ribazoletransferase
MKDSQIGSYGTIALVLSLLLRWYYFTLLFGFGLFFAPLIIAGTASRVGMVVVMQALPNARSGGLSDQTGKPGWSAVGGAIVIALIVGLMTVGGMRTLAAFLCLTVFGTGIALLARAKIGGQTGDALGATQQIGEIAILVLMLELLGP